MTLNQKIGQKIRKARKIARLTQKELGDLLGKSGATIAYLEQGKRRVSPNILESIAQKTDQSLSFFYEDQESQSSDLGAQIKQLKDQLEQINGVLKRAEKKCLETEEKFQLLFEEANDPMILIAASGKILDVNKAYQALLGKPRKEIVDKFFWEISFSSSDQTETFVEAFHQAIKREEALELVRHPFKTGNGDIIEVESSSRLLHREGKVWAMLSILRPVRQSPQLFDLVSG